MKFYLRLLMSICFIAVSSQLIKAQDYFIYNDISPFNSAELFNVSTPAIIDIDNDGDFDVFFGEDPTNNLHTFLNVGTPSLADYEKLVGKENPLENYSNGSGCNAPSFVDIDADGDFDLAVANWFGEIRFMQNIGTKEEASFVQLYDAENPFSYITTKGICGYAAFTDIDADGDFDCYISDDLGNIDLHRNIGNATEAIFEKDSINNPFNSMQFENRVKLVFQDINKDGVLDVVISEEADPTVLLYFKNNGSNDVPNYEKMEGTDNPFDGIQSEHNLTPLFADIDNDGDDDLILGDRGKLKLYKASQSNQTKDLIQGSIEISPNPAMDYLTIKSDLALSSYEIITNYSIRIQKGKLANINEMINLTDVPTGFYIIRLHTDSKSYSRKLYVEH